MSTTDPEEFRVDRGVRPLEARAWLCDQWDDEPPKVTTLYALNSEEVAAVNKLRARKEWQTRQTHLCRCDHSEYCRHCWPESFRPGGVWNGLGS